MKFDEREIISKIVKGDQRSFELLVKKYQQLVFYIIHKLVNNREDKEDICQEVFIKVYRNINKFEFQSKFSTWIGRIAYLTALNYLRDSKKDKTEDIVDLEALSFTDVNPESLLVKKDNSIFINDLIEQMPIAYKTVITLYHINEFSYQEIEEITGMPGGTVKNYLFRARKLLKDKLVLHLKNEIV